MNDTCFKSENFPEELLIDILSRLEPKPLSRCKSVSKHWNTTLTIQAFMLKHFQSYDKHSKLAFVSHRMIKGDDSVISYELSDNKITSNTTMIVPKTTKISREEVIIGNHECFANALSRHKCNHMSNICNDLICLFDYFSTRVGLFNLKTRDFIQLPAVTRDSACNIRFWYALGFDQVNKVYKVLSLYGGTIECCTKAAILTVGSKHWKPVEYEFLRSEVSMKPLYWRSHNRFCFDGVIYWVNDNKIANTSVLTVAAFDLNREVFTDYKLDTIPITDVGTIRYYLTSLKGNPTLFIWQAESDEIKQLTLFNHKNPKAAWNTRSFTTHDFPKNYPYGNLWTCVAGGSILLHPVKPFKSSVETQEQDNSRFSWYRWYDLENFAIE
ncbi:putative F-box protein At2g02030 [Silene latifolia]|uniref:putative F-box protein At2g02030 n=1 Tax=Silene latifolia TaxID=37657 RepID=UPI003D76AB29